MTARSILLPFVRSYRLPVFCLLSLVVGFASAILPGRPIAVPLRDQVSADPWPLALAALATFLPIVLASPDPALEVSLPVRPWRTRLAVAIASTAIALLTLFLSAELADRSWVQALRNYAVAAAVALLLSLWMRIEQVWLGPLGLILSNWLYGVDDSFNTARSWAVLMYGPSAESIGIALGVWCLGLVSWVVLGSAADRRD